MPHFRAADQELAGNGRPAHGRSVGMTDKDVEREIEANQQREVDARNEAEDDGAVLDTAERVVAPIVDVIRRPGEDLDEADLEERRELNDEEQQPG
jgi:hypothetical protein